jgi:S-adenosyl methyltransferase
MTPNDDWRRAATAEQMSALTHTIDPTVAHIARVQDYWLGGKDHFEADRVAGDEAIAQLPDMAASVRNTRAFLAGAADQPSRGAVRLHRRRRSRAGEDTEHGGGGARLHRAGRGGADGRPSVRAGRR